MNERLIKYTKVINNTLQNLNSLQMFSRAYRVRYPPLLFEIKDNYVHTIEWRAEYIAIGVREAHSNIMTPPKTQIESCVFAGTKAPPTLINYGRAGVGKLPTSLFYTPIIKKH